MADDAHEGVDCGRAFQYLRTIARRERPSDRFYVDGPARWLGSRFGIAIQVANLLLERLQDEGYGELDGSGSRFTLANGVAVVAQKTKAFLDRREVARTSTEAGLPLEPGLHTPVFLEDCFEAVSAHYRLESDQVLGPSRTQPLALHRQMMMYVMRERTRSSFPTIASFFKRDHTTVMHACGVISERLKHDQALARDLIAIHVLLGRR